jgi:hypothetical protein
LALLRTARPDYGKITDPEGNQMLQETLYFRFFTSTLMKSRLFLNTTSCRLVKIADVSKKLYSSLFSVKHSNVVFLCCLPLKMQGHTVVQLIDALHYNAEGYGFDS